MKTIFTICILTFIAGDAWGQNLLINGNFESDPFPAAWTIFGSPATIVPHAGLVAGSSRAAFLTAGSALLEQSVAGPPALTFDTLLAAAQGSVHQSLSIYLYGSGRNYTGLQFLPDGSLHTQNGTPLFGGSPLIAFSADVNSNNSFADPGDTLNVYHLRIVGHFDDLSPTYDVLLSDANSLAFTHIQNGLADWDSIIRPAPGTGLTKVRFLSDSAPSSIDEVALTPEPGLTTITLILALLLLLRRKREKTIRTAYLSCRGLPLVQHQRVLGSSTMTRLVFTACVVACLTPLAVPATPAAASFMGWAVGVGGTIVHTTDGGDTWSSQSSGTTAWLSAVASVDASTAWVVGDGGLILHTTDGGATWLPQSSGTTARLLSVTFSSPREGWAVGRLGTIVHTVDAGTTWSSQSSGITSDLSGVDFSGTSDGWAVGGGKVVHTINGGTTWTTQNPGVSMALFSVTSADATHAWIGSSFGALQTTDSGATWISRLFSNGPQNARAVAFPDALSGWAADASGGLFHSSDGGMTWSSQPVAPVHSSFFGISFPDASNGWLTDSRGRIFRTSNGADWVSESSGVTSQLNGIAIVPEPTFLTAAGLMFLLLCRRGCVRGNSGAVRQGWPLC